MKQTRALGIICTLLLVLIAPYPGLAYPEFTCTDVTEIPQIECEALVALYNSTNGDDWINKSYWLWVTTPSSWYGVTVESGHVTVLYMVSNQLSGFLPPELGSLSYLAVLILQGNQLSGSIPSELGNLSNLHSVMLDNNLLGGSIPAELGNLSHLTNMSLSGNLLSGSIPPELGNLSSLWNLGLGRNLLSGSIPPELGKLSAVAHITLENNRLSGVIPAELGDLSGLYQLNLSHNQLSGSIPPEIGDLSSLGYLDLSSNQLSGPIPSELGDLSSLQTLYMSGNLLADSIPPELGDLSSLEYLRLDNNQLSGPIPSTLGSIPYLRLLDLSHNLLNGAIPPDLGNLASVYELSVNLENNQLSGSIPSQLGSMDYLIHLDLSGNLLSGSIPPELANTRIYILDLSKNQLSGSIPYQVGVMNLQLLHLDQNNLEGDIPWTFINLTNLVNPGSWIDGSDGLNLDYNNLNVPPDYPDPTVPLQVFLHQKDPDWHTLQTFEQVIGSDGGTLISLDGSVEVVIPEETLDEDTIFTFTPQPVPTHNNSLLGFAGVSFQLIAENDAGPVTSFPQPITININFTDDDIRGIVEESLALYYWDEAATTWVDAVTTCPGGAYTRDLAGNTISLPVCHLSEFALFGNPLLRTLLPILVVAR